MIRTCRRLLLSAFLLGGSALLPASEMVKIPGGTYRRGLDSDRFKDEGPAHKVTVDSFLIDVHEVTNADFRTFVEATGYKTQAERGWSAKDFPKAPPETLKPGALIFSAPPEELDPKATSHWQWWKFRPGASWQRPLGPDSNLEGKEQHPVVCLTWEDANAYAKWAGKRLPTEAEWELAARGGLEKALFVWGNDPKPSPDSWPANIFTGTFPHADSAADGFSGTAPVKSFPPNGYGLFDMAGNVWELCADFYHPDAYATFLKDPRANPTGPTRGLSEPEVRWFYSHQKYPEPAVFGKPHPLSVLHVMKGGSYLCHHSYCLRYRPAARHYSEGLAPTNHTGFRCAKDLTP